MRKAKAFPGDFALFIISAAIGEEPSEHISSTVATITVMLIPNKVGPKNKRNISGENTERKIAASISPKNIQRKTSLGLCKSSFYKFLYIR